jgi:hypothetical protein
MLQNCAPEVLGLNLCWAVSYPDIVDAFFSLSKQILSNLEILIRQFPMIISDILYDIFIL